MNVTSKISVDLTRPNMGTWVNAVQGDGNTRIVEVSLLSGGEAWEPPADAEAAIAYYQLGGVKGLYNLLADGTAAISISGNVATVILAPQMLTASGTVQASLVFNDQQLNRLTTFPFSVFVESNPAAGAQTVEDYLRLQWLEDKLDEYLRKAADSGEFDGKPGDNGVTFTPSVSENGDISWRNNGGLPNPKTVNIRGPQGDSTAATAAAHAAQTSAANAETHAANAATSAAAAQAAADAMGTELSHIKEDLSDKLPKSPTNWEAWTAEEQAAAREMIKTGSAWGMDLPLLKTITLEEAVSSIDILSREEGITLQEFSVFLFATAAGDDGVAFSGFSCLRSNGGAQYWGYSDGYIQKTVNAYKIWHTKIYDNKFAVTDIAVGRSGSSSDIAYGSFQGLADASNEQRTCVTSINSAYPINNLNLLLIGASASGAVIPRGSMIFLFGR